MNILMKVLLERALNAVGQNLQRLLSKSLKLKSRGSNRTPVSGSGHKPQGHVAGAAKRQEGEAEGSK